MPSYFIIDLSLCKFPRRARTRWVTERIASTVLLRQACVKEFSAVGMLGCVMSTPDFDSADLCRLQSQLTAWRNRQTGRPRLPKSLWQAAAALSRIHGVSRVSRSLGVGYRKLRRIAAVNHPVDSPRRQVASPPSTQPFPFVEVQLPAHLPGWTAPAAHVSAVEFSDSTQRKLRIEMSTDPDRASA